MYLNKIVTAQHCCAYCGPSRINYKRTATLIRCSGNFPPMLLLVTDTSKSSDFEELNYCKNNDIVVSTVERPESLRRTIMGEHAMRHVRCVSGGLEKKARSMKWRAFSFPKSIRIHFLSTKSMYTCQFIDKIIFINHIIIAAYYSRMDRIAIVSPLRLPSDHAYSACINNQNRSYGRILPDLRNHRTRNEYTFYFHFAAEFLRPLYLQIFVLHQKREIMDKSKLLSFIK